ncbi:MAG: cation:proton antiporter, partial [Acidimicrobiia bacterium]
VLTAVVTSLFAGAWFRYVLNRGWPLLRVRGEDMTDDSDGDSGDGDSEGPLAPVKQVPARTKEPVR